MTRAQEARASLVAIAELVDDERGTIEDLRFDVSWKDDGSPVTRADVYVEQRVQALLDERLGPVTFLGEETFTGWDGDLDGWVAVLDPIDGTENFCSGLKEWGVSLTLWHDGVHAGSMLLLPDLGERLITGDVFTPFRSRITGFSSSISMELAEQVVDADQGRIIGCAVYNLFNVVRGSYARFSNPVGAYSWDLLAGVMLALEHGCEVQIDDEPFTGRFLEPGRKHRVDVRR